MEKGQLKERRQLGWGLPKAELFQFNPFPSAAGPGVSPVSARCAGAPSSPGLHPPLTLPSSSSSAQEPLCQRPAEANGDQRPLGSAHQLIRERWSPRGTRHLILILLILLAAACPASQDSVFRRNLINPAAFESQRLKLVP